MNSTNLIGWILTAASLIGYAANLKKQRVCFLIWIGTNSGWAWISIAVARGWIAPMQQFPRFWLDAIYILLSIWGYWKWGQDK